ncbi:hypothetical protein Tco_1121882 [Tanacetum coccineum]|uniref:Uncharacterized protein n=1 Tax=Tanacetum coccineum TaxID=301880 RepID=A0ABQ5IZ19_9ASTR
MEISSDRDFLCPAPSYVLIRDPVRRLCHRMIAYNISSRGQALEKYLFRHAEGRKSGARLSGGHFIGHLAMHFGLVSDEGLRGLQATAAGAHEADEADQAAEEVAPKIPAPAQAPPPPPPAPQPRLRGVVESFTIEQSKFSTWMISCMTQLMDVSGQTYQPFKNTLVGSSWLSFWRCVRPRTCDASTSTAPHTDAQPDP